MNWDFPFKRLKNIISPYDINELTKITLNNQEFSISRHFFENLNENTFFMPYLSSNPCFCTDLDRSLLHKFKFSAILGISRTQLAQVSNDRCVQESHGTMILIPSPLPSEISHILNVSPLWHRFLSVSPGVS